MKKLAFIICGLAILSAAVAADVKDLAPLVPPYWIVGTVPDSGGVAAEGRTVVFYKDDADLLAGNFAAGVVSNHVFILNAFSIWPTILEAGQAYKVAVARDPVLDASLASDGPLDVTVSGRGWDEVSGLSLTNSVILPTPVTMEAAPVIKLWFNDRLYQPALVDPEQGKVFVISSTPKLKVDLSIEGPYMLSSDLGAYTIEIDPNTENTIPLTVKAENVAQKIYAAGTAPEENLISALSLEFTLAEPLAAGEHIFMVTARSSGAIATAATAVERAQVEVMGGPARLIGAPLTFPSPFSKTEHGKVIIQYTLSTDTAVQIILVDISGNRVMNIVCEKGTPGGTAGINKVEWNGVTDRGTFAGNGIYVGTILARDEARKLGSVKLTIVD